MDRHDVDQTPELAHVAMCSRYLASLLRRESHVHWLWDQGHLKRAYPLTELYKDLRSTALPCTSLEELSQAMRTFKQRHFLRIGSRDYLGLADFGQCTAGLSDLAEVCLQIGTEWLSRNPGLWSRSELSTEECSAQLSDFAVLGMGKLGGRELNYVSDIDLLFLQSGGDGSRRPDSELKARFGRALSRLLDKWEHGDRVFNTDLRLRPSGKDGDLVPTITAAVYHYQLSGQAWERQALLKARALAGDRGIGNLFLKEVRPFVFRRFLDFQALDELKSMRDKILAEESQKTLQSSGDVKLGRGGIREIEFIVQSFQLIYGGRYRELNEPNTLKCLEKLEKLKLVPMQMLQDLQQATVFLRRVEHWVQLDQNKQSHKIPRSENDQHRLSRALGFDGSLKRFQDVLDEHRRVVHEHFSAMFQQKKTNAQSKPASKGVQADPGPEPGWQELASLFSTEVVSQLQDIKVSEAVREEGGTTDLPKGVETFLHQVKTRPGLVRLINGSPPWLHDVLRGIASSKLIAGLLSNQPSLIEGMEQQGFTQGFQEWRARAEAILESGQDYEQSLEWIRRLKNERMLLLALSDLHGHVRQVDLGLELSFLAEFIIQNTFQAVCRAVGRNDPQRVSVLGLGKLGSRELGYLSDLDVMFVFDSVGGQDQDSIPPDVVRLIQRFMRMLSTPLQEGPGYAVDAKLRPSGNYGPLIVTRKRWEEYYSHEADIWEVQALLKLRAVAGDQDLGARLERASREICYQHRDSDQVWPRLCHLRKRMEEERSGERQGGVSLKLGYGGLTDLEFLVQGFQLLQGVSDVRLRSSSFLDQLPRALELAGVSQEQNEGLVLGYSGLRSLEQRLQLKDATAPTRINSSQFDDLRARGLWPVDQDSSPIRTWSDLLSMRRRIRRVWSSICQEQE